MSNVTIHYNRKFMAVIAGAAWFALIGQLYLIIINRSSTIPETLLTYFSYFTILSNLIVAISLSVLLIGPAGKWGRFFSRPSTLSAITVYIAVVGIIYNTILRFLWAPQGFQRLVDEMLHLVVPVLFIIFWAVCVPKQHLKWGMVLPWMIYPLLYMVWTVVHGAFSNFYPYPFVDVTKLGYPVVIRNGGLMLLFFVVLSLVLILIGKRKKRSADHVFK